MSEDKPKPPADLPKKPTYDELASFVKHMATSAQGCILLKDEQTAKELASRLP